MTAFPPSFIHYAIRVILSIIFLLAPTAFIFLVPPNVFLLPVSVCFNSDAYLLSHVCQQGEQAVGSAHLAADGSFVSRRVCPHASRCTDGASYLLRSQQNAAMLNIF